MKKYTKLFIFTILTCFLTIISTNAKQVNLDELGKEIDKVASDASSAYIIGDYVFTSQHTLTTQDLMLAARSISLTTDDGLINTTPSYGKMAIQRIVRQYDENADPIGWEVKTNALGTAKLELDNTKKINIKYIDYNLVKEDSTLKVDLNSNTFEQENYKKALSEDLKIEDLSKLVENLTINGQNEISGLLLKYTIDDSVFPKEDQTGYYFPFVLEVPNASANTKITITGKKTKTISYDNFDVKEKGKESIVILWSVDPNNANKKITITIDLDGEGETYDTTTYTIDYSNLKFQEDSEYTVDTNKVSSNDQSTFESWGYDANKNKSLSLKDGKLTGTLVEQELISDEAFGASNRKGYYFDFTIILGADPQKAKVEQVKDKDGSDVIKTFKESEFDEAGNLTILRRVSEDPKCSTNAENCKIYIRIDLDGSGNEYLPVIYELDYSQVTFEKSSFSKIEKEDNGKLKEVFGWEAKNDNGYNVSITQDTSNHSLYHVSGLLPIYEDNEFNSGHNVPFGNGHNTKYYFGYKITTTEGTKTDNTTVTIESAYEEDEIINVTSTDFDDDNSLNVLAHIHPNATNKTITITIDLDGNGEEYAPYTITLDYSDLKYQTVSTTTVSKDLNEESKTEFTSWGYKSEANGELTYTTEEGNVTKVSGKLVEQELSDTPFGPDKKDGYYFTFAFVKPAGVESIENAKIYRLKNKPETVGTTELPGLENIQKTFDKSEFDADGTLTILYRFAPETAKCEVGTEENCKLYYVVDYDGDGKEYLPALYVIDYSGLTFEKSSIFTIEALTSTDKDDFADGSFLEKDGYYTEITQVEGNPLHYKVTGVLPIFEDSEWDNGKDPLEPTNGNFYYYLGLRLKLVNKLTTSEETPSAKDIVKFLHGDAEDELFQANIKAGDLNQAGELNILKYVLPTDEDKTFTITVDLDGPEEDEYAPYTVTIDYSELKFQSESLESEFGLLESSDLAEGTPEKKELDGYGFNLETVSDVEIKKNSDQPDREPYIEGIKGTIKEQNLNKGFKENKGYFVPIKISIPKDEDWFAPYINSWELILNTESDGTKIYKPTPEEYAQGWVMVLFKITKEGKDGVKSIKYSIDYDGASNKEAHTGDAFLPYEYEIKYDELEFKSEETITYHYFDSTGAEQTVTVKAYEGDTVVPQSMEEQNTPYRTFTKWTDETGKDVTSGFTIEDGKNVTLTANWSLDVDAFVEDFIDDLADPNSETSEDYSDRFTITKDGNTITIDVKDATMKLTEMDNTTIPGAIAYILDKGEVKEITLTTDFKNKTNQKVVFSKEGETTVQLMSLNPSATSLKEKVQQGAQALFTAVLADEFTDMTLNKMAVSEGGYTITIGTTENNVTLKDNENKIYTVKFTTKATDVKNESELDAALQNKNIETITIADSFAVTKSHKIDRSLEIISGGGSETSYTITATSEAIAKGIFDISSPNVNISNVKLTAANVAIFVEGNGSLTFSKLDLTGNSNAGIEIKGSGTISGDKLTMTNESYDTPAIRVTKTGSATVRLTDSTNSQAGKVTKQKIIESNGKSDEGDKLTNDEEYAYYNYYNNPAAGKIYKTKFMNLEGPYRLEFIRYTKYNETIKTPPVEEGSRYTTFDSFNYSGHDYKILGYSTSGGMSKTPKVLGGECETDGITLAENLKATDDNVYFAAYCMKLQKGTVEVSSTEEFKAELAKPDVKSIYIKPGTTIDYENEVLTINRAVNIVSRENTNRAKIKAKKINITASGVFFQKINFEINATDGDALIYASLNDSKLLVTLWQVNVKNTGSAIQSAIKVSSNTEVVIDVRWSDFESTNLSNYIYADGPVGEGTHIYGNTFNALTNSQEGTVKNSAVIFKDFAIDAVANDEVSDVRLESNTYRGTDNYSIKILKDASSKVADISLGYSKDVTIAVEYDDDHKDFDKIHFLVKYIPKKVVYIKGSEITEGAPKDVNGIKVTSTMVTE